MKLQALFACAEGCMTVSHIDSDTTCLRRESTSGPQSTDKVLAGRSRSVLALTVPFSTLGRARVSSSCLMLICILACIPELL